jgi:acetyl-CoA carboxylase carboxyl transferase subunit beta
MDWRTNLLAQVSLTDAAGVGRNPVQWPGYEPRLAVRFGDGRIGDHDVVAVVWDFEVFGGSIGEREADSFVAGVRRAIELRRPLVTLVRTGGTRLQEGMAALVGIPRMSLALDELSGAGLPHVSIADHPTTGGVWVSVVSGADVRAGVAGATVGFSGPRVIEAMTGEAVTREAQTAESAYAAGLLDNVLRPEDVASWLGSVLAVFGNGDTARSSTTAPIEPVMTKRTGAEQVAVARTADRLSGAALLDVVLDSAVDLRVADRSVRAVIGRSALGRSTIGVAVAADRDGRPTVAGYQLLVRAAGLADRMGNDLLTLVDTPGADSRPESEDAGVAGAIRAGLVAVLSCRSATLAVVHGEGGSGGALAAATTDEVLVTDTSYFAALGPEGAAVAVQLTAAEVAERMAVTPQDLRALGFADAFAPSAPDDLRLVVAERLAALAQKPQTERIARRQARWAGPLPGRCDP